MSTSRDLLPTKYEVLRLRNGIEICGMTRDTGAKILITLPMICKLAALHPKETLATFYPYAPLSSDYIIELPHDYIVHRNALHEQYIPFYDEASSQWLNMLEDKTIPLVTHSEYRKVKDYMDGVLDDLVTEMRSYREDDDDHFEEFERAVLPTDKKKIH